MAIKKIEYEVIPPGKPDGMNDRWDDPDTERLNRKLWEQELADNKTLHAQLYHLHEAWVALGHELIKKLRLTEICAWVNNFLRGLKGSAAGQPYGDLASRYMVDDINYYVLLRFMQKINAEEMEFSGVSFQRGQLLLVNISTRKPPEGKIEVVLTFKVHSGKWTTAPKVMIPRRPRWRGYKFAELSGRPMLEHVKMQELIDYLTEM